MIAPLKEKRTVAEIQKLILDVPDFPKKGIVFKDITPILEDHVAFRSLVHYMAENLNPEITHLAAVESRGFILGAALAQHVDKGLVLVRKPGKLPRATESQTYELEYGTDTLEIHREQISPGDKVAIIDDVLATGGTAHAVEQLVTKMGAKVSQHLFLMELGFLNGKDKLQAPVSSLITY